MKIRNYIGAFIILVLTISLVNFSFYVESKSQYDVSDNFVPGEALIKFKSDEAKKVFFSNFEVKNELKATTEKYKAKSDYEKLDISSLDEIKSNSVEDKNFAKLKTLDVINKYKNDPNIEYIEPNFIAKANYVPNDPSFSSQWGLRNTGQSGGTSGMDMQATTAWDATLGSSSVIIAVIDTGVDYTHPDLNANIVANGQTNSGYDFVNSDSDPKDDNGHGTHVSGIIAAVGNNSVGISGTCPKCKILPQKALSGGGSGTFQNIADAIIDSVYKGAKIINLSLGSPYDSQTLKNAVKFATDQGVTVVASAGNCGVWSLANCDWNENNVQDADEINYTSYPAAYPGVISVGAIQRDGQRAPYSQTGNWLTVVAPGSEILSTCANNTYCLYSGTSAAAPFVAGGVGLMMSKNSAIDNVVTGYAITSSATNLGTIGYDSSFGNGLINLNSALVKVPELNNASNKKYYYPFYAMVNGHDAVNLVANASTTETALVTISVPGVQKKWYTIAPGQMITPYYPNTVGGPVEIESTNGVPIFTTQRSVYGFNGSWSLSEFAGIPSNQLTTKYYYPFYAMVNGHDAVNLVSNPSSSQSATVTIKIGGQLKGTYTIAPGQMITPYYPNTVGGPVEIESTNGVPIFTTQRSVYGFNGSWSLSEFAGIPSNQLTTKYYYPFYAMVNGHDAVNLVSNPSSSQSATVTIKIGGQLKGTYTIAPGQMITPYYPNTVGGPVEIESTNGVPIFTTQRSVYGFNGSWSLSEFAGIPSNQLTTKYYYPFYAMVNGHDAVNLVSNPSSSQSATVTIKIGGQLKGTYTIAPGQMITPYYPNTVGGPVEIESTNGVPIFTTQRSVYGFNGSWSLSEFAGIPSNQL